MKVAVRVALLVVGFAAAGLVLARAFNGFDASEVGAALAGLGWADYLRLAGVFVVLLAAQAFLAAAFVPGLSMRHGLIAWLGSNAVAMMVPGPSDVPLRYKMFRSWGLPAGDAATATAGATLLNSVHKLVLPAIAAAGLAVGDVDVGGVRNAVIAGCVVFTGLAVVVGFAFGTEARTAAAGRLVGRAIRRPVAHRLVRYRNGAVGLVRVTWKRALIGLVLVVGVSVVLFVACMRAAGLPATAASALALFCVWALVRGLTVLPTMPGDAGVSELAYVSLLSQVAGSQHVNAAAAGVVLYRLITWIALIPLGAIAIAAWRWGLRHRGQPEPEAPDEVVAA
jgi:hypothetical protein